MSLCRTELQKRALWRVKGLAGCGASCVWRPCPAGGSVSSVCNCCLAQYMALTWCQHTTCTLCIWAIFVFGDMCKHRVIGDR
jgi:hypothetical protein